MGNKKGEIMKKRILLVVIASFMFMGVVSASSMWGDYKGNRIIMLTVDDTPVKVSDVPAISYQGRTMIPIYLLKEAGIKYSWDQYNQTVNIQKGIIQESSNDDDIKTIKNLSSVASYYDSVLLIGDMLTDMSGGFDIVSRAIERGEGESALDNYLTRFNTVIRMYNDLFDRKEKLESILKGTNIDIGESQESLNYYSEAINYYKISYSGLEDYFNLQNETNFRKYLNNASKGFDSSFEGKSLASDDFYKFMNYIQNY